MKTIIYDTNNIVRAIGNPVIEPVETQKKVAGLIEATAEYQTAQTKSNELKNRQKMANDKLKEAQHALYVQRNQTETDRLNAEYRALLEICNQVETELIPMMASLEVKRKELAESNKVYFEPKEGEKIISSAEADSLAAKIENAGKHELVKVDGSIIFDYRDKKYWLKSGGTWSSGLITQLGENIPAGSILDEELSDVQRGEIGQQLEVERIKALTPEEKEAEKQAKVDGIATQAANMRSKLEIQGDPDALAKSQAWYNLEVEKINSTYAV